MISGNSSNCPRCGAPSLKVIYMGFPFKLCTDEECSCVFGFWHWILGVVPLNRTTTIYLLAILATARAAYAPFAQVPVTPYFPLDGVVIDAAHAGQPIPLVITIVDPAALRSSGEVTTPDPTAPWRHAIQFRVWRIRLVDVRYYWCALIFMYEFDDRLPLAQQVYAISGSDAQKDDIVAFESSKWYSVRTPDLVKHEFSGEQRVPFDGLIGCPQPSASPFPHRRLEKE